MINVVLQKNILFCKNKFSFVRKNQVVLLHFPLIGLYCPLCLYKSFFLCAALFFCMWNPGVVLTQGRSLVIDSLRRRDKCSSLYASSACELS